MLAMLSCHSRTDLAGIIHVAEHGNHSDERSHSSHDQRESCPKAKEHHGIAALKCFNVLSLMLATHGQPKRRYTSIMAEC